MTTVAVVGGGIGGLTAALSLLRAGFDVHVYEQAGELGEVGAGVQISPNASRILHQLGLGEELDAAAVRPVAWRQRRWEDGRTLLHAPLGDAAIDAFGFRTTSCIAPTCSRPSPARCRPSASTPATAW